MFSRIREAIRIVTYREPESGVDAVFVAHVEPSSSRYGKTISRFLEGFIALYTVGYAAGKIGDYLWHITNARHFSMSTGTLIGVLAAFLMLIIHWIKADIEAKFRDHFHIANWLAPFFGRKLDSVARVLRGTASVS